ncbi:exported hypothetical protein [Actinacidiphila cocklensis]|uniref:Uncharacterized protein n=1 Tax=Actinacidiphila cocklensis TaxID=887465 RepID=A0A9W4DU42_9ACTN|nr:exported hypothetical protein [Actinacidiphila cocklensis]
MMAAAVVSALALGGVAVGMAAVTRSFAPGEGAGNAPQDTRPPAAVATDGTTAGPWTAAPGMGGANPLTPPVRSGADEHSTGSGTGSGTGRTGGFGRTGGHGFGQGQDHGCGHFGGKGRKDGHGGGAVTGPDNAGKDNMADKAAQDRAGKPGKARAGAGAGPRHSRPGRRPASRAPGR